MKEDKIEDLFKELEGRFDTEEPRVDHHNRFLDKLQKKESKKLRHLQWWKPLSIAASVIIIIAVALTRNNTPELKDLADISPEMEKTQEFFTATISKELFEIQEKATPATQQLIDDAIVRLEALENEYMNLKNDLTHSGEDKRVIYAMIDNFQNRINLLQQVLEQIDAINTLNTLQSSAL